MKYAFLRRLPLAAAGLLLLSAFACTETAVARDEGWEIGLDTVYQNTTTLDFKGGTTAKIATDVGLSVNFGYNFTEHLETTFSFDWANVGYSARIVTAAGGAADARGDYQSFTPRINLQYNIMTTLMTPYLMGGVGYSFINTNIPNGRPVSGCYWDPWYGYICGTAQNTKTVDGFAYQAGAGVIWDATEYFSFRLAYERHWVDFGSQGAPYLDQAKLGFTWRY